MKGLTLCFLLLGALVVALVYAASNGMGIRTPSFATGNYAPIESKPQHIIGAEPLVQVESNAVTAESIMPKMPAPEVKVSLERHHKKVKRQARIQAQTKPKQESNLITAVASKTTPKAA